MEKLPLKPYPPHLVFIVTKEGLLGFVCLSSPILASFKFLVDFLDLSILNIILDLNTIVI